MEEEDDNKLEEGEIEEEDNYILLERPSNYTSMIQPNFVTHPESSEEEEQKSSSDSNSDCEDTQPKRAKLKPKLQLRPTKQKKYDIWCSSAQDDVLDNLTKIDVSHVDRSRDVETYRTTNKRLHSERSNNLLRPIKRTDFEEHKSLQVKKRTILNLNFSEEDQEEDIAKDMANKLWEQKEDLIRLVVDVAGKTKALELFRETQRIENEGGMLIMNHSRRRTPGGVFLHLVKKDPDITPEQQDQIFSEDKLKFKQDIRNKKKIKMQIVKQQVKAAGAKLLPELISRRKLELENVTKKKDLDADVINPPPSPVTDNSPDPENSAAIVNYGLENKPENSDRNLVNYDADFLDIGGDMELF